MRILIAGGSGLIGSHLSKVLREEGNDVFILSRKKSNDPQIIQWSVDEKWIDSDLKFDVVVNLTGAGLVDKKWTGSYKQEIVQSRVDSIVTLDQYFQKRDFAPRVFLSSSAVGIYGHHAERMFSEEDEAIQSDFLVFTCEAWEQAAHDMETPIQHKYISRTGVVLARDDGAFPKLKVGRPVGVVPHLGSGEQYYSWIHIDDVVGIFHHLILARPISGTYNVVAPNPAKNVTISRTIACTGLLGVSPSVPEFMVNLLLGERKITVLNSTRASADKIISAGYDFIHPQLNTAIGDLVRN